VNAPLRILFALPGLHRVGRGAEVAFESVAREIARRPGFDVTLIGSGAAGSGGPGYRFLHAGCVARERFDRWPKIPPLRSGYAYEELSFMPGLLRAYDPGSYDATVTCAYPFTNWALRARKRAGRRPAHLFVTQNGDWPARAVNAEYRWFACDGLVCTNPEYFERHKGRWHSALIPNGVDPAAFMPGPGSRAEFGIPHGVPVILSVAALIPSKRVVEGVRAAAGVPGAHVVVAGDGPLRADIERMGRELLPGRFQRLVAPRERMPSLYQSADVLLHMSKDEPFGNIYIEAMSTGLPVVAHDTPTTRWITDGRAALVDTDDGSAVAAALESALRSGGEGAEARRAVVESRFSWSAVADSYCRFITEVANARA
jgi:glycosyltransferase involved in cell wall biosynthesis